MDLLLEIVREAAPSIKKDFDRPADLVPFWTHYPPEPRGNKPRYDSIPWGEMGEKAVSANFNEVLFRKAPSATYPGLPGGSDMRFAVEDALVHFDFKVTGPRDNENQVVASPNQISGDGLRWKSGGVVRRWKGGGIVNSAVTVTGPGGKSHEYEPTLPPFYMLDGNILLNLTYFLKVVYRVEEMGHQPLCHLELVCVPNGLLLFDGPRYADTKYLFTPGKDKKGTKRKRARVNFDPLARIEGWRCIRLEPAPGGWTLTPRHNSSAK